MNTNILNQIKNTINIEINSLNFLLNSVDDHYISAVENLNNCKGKIVVCGIGKSAIIGQKMVATFNSTGTPAQFLHASEAFHGDLGMINPQDIVICISNSGNSPEIKQIIPYLKQSASKLIGITGNPESDLAKNSDIILNSYVEKEACPHNLAPTSSTMVQMAIGDALAVSLMELKQFSKQDFAKFHPGGTLGKNISWTINQFLDPKQKPMVEQNSSIKEVILSLSSSKYGATVVLDNHKIVGIITDGDLRRMLSNHHSFETITAKEIMGINPKTIDHNELGKTALEMMQKHDIGQLIVTKNNEYLGLLDIHQLLDEGISSD